MKKRICSTIPNLTLTQIEDIKDFYEDEDVSGERFSTSRIIIISVNFFWKHIFEDPNS